MKRLRGVTLELLYTRHTEQASRYDGVALWSALVRLGIDLGQNDMLTVLQDMQERGYVTFHAEKNKLTNRMAISQVQIAPRGRDLIEETITDPAVTV
jgi:hypothetical protein